MKLEDFDDKIEELLQVFKDYLSNYGEFEDEESESDNADDESLEDERLEEYMEEYQDLEEDDELPYSMSDVDNCGVILRKFIKNLAKTQGDEKKIMKCVKKVVLKLNKFNEKLDYGFIETEERELLYEFIMTAVNAAGFETDEDITEEWRDW